MHATTIALPANSLRRDLRSQPRVAPPDRVLAAHVPPRRLEDTAAVVHYSWSMEAVLLLLVSSAGAILVNLSGTFLLSACNPISHVLLGQAKTCALLLSGSAFFGQQHSSSSLAGSALAMGSIVGYTFSNLVEQDKGRAPTKENEHGKAPKQE